MFFMYSIFRFIYYIQTDKLAQFEDSKRNDSTEKLFQYLYVVCAKRFHLTASLN